MAGTSRSTYFSRRLLQGLLAAVALQVVIVTGAFVAVARNSLSSAAGLREAQHATLEESAYHLFRRTFEGAAILTENAASRIAAEPARYLNPDRVITRVFSVIADRLEYVHVLQFTDAHGVVRVDSRSEEYHGQSLASHELVVSPRASPPGATYVGRNTLADASTSLVFSAPVYAAGRQPGDPPVGVVVLHVEPLIAELPFVSRDDLFGVELVNHEGTVLYRRPADLRDVSGAVQISRERVIRHTPEISMRTIVMRPLHLRDWFPVRGWPLVFLVLLALGTLILELGLLWVLSRLNSAHHEALEEREVLVREVHHRVKNNLQVLASLMNLQRGLLDSSSVAAAPALHAMDAVGGRIAAMAEVHEALYRAERLDRVSLREMVASLVERWRHAADGAVAVDFTWCDGLEVLCPIDQATPLSMVLNELVGNAVHHGAPADAAERHLVAVTVSPEYSAGGGVSDRVIITIEDHGAGMENAARRESAGLGLQLVELLKDQIPAECRRESREEPGTFWLVIIKNTG